MTKQNAQQLTHREWSFHCSPKRTRSVLDLIADPTTDVANHHPSTPLFGTNWPMSVWRKLQLHVWMYRWCGRLLVQMFRERCVSCHLVRQGCPGEEQGHEGMKNTQPGPKPSAQKTIPSSKPTLSDPGLRPQTSLKNCRTWYGSRSLLKKAIAFDPSRVHRSIGRAFQQASQHGSDGRNAPIEDCPSANREQTI